MSFGDRSAIVFFVMISWTKSWIPHFLIKYRKWVFFGILALLVVDLLEVLPPLILRAIIDHLQGQPSWISTIFQGAVAYVAIAFIQAAGRYGWRVFLIRMSFYSGKDLRQELYQHVSSCRRPFFLNRSTGELVSVVSQDVEAIRFALGGGMIVLLDSLFYLLTVPFAMIWLSPQLTGIVLIPVLFVPFIVLWCEKRIHQRFTKLQEILAKLSGFVQESLSGVKLLKSSGVEHWRQSQFEIQSAEAKKVGLNLARVQVVFGPSLDFCMRLSLLLLLIVGGSWVFKGTLTIGTLVAFQRYLSQIVWPMEALGQAINIHQRARASEKRIDEIFEEKNLQQEKFDSGNSVTLNSSLQKDAGTMLDQFFEPTSLELVFKKFSLKVSDRERPILDQISLDVKPGTLIGFAGPVGSGKTALFESLLRIRDVEPGKIFLEGKDLCEWDLKELRKKIGYVRQEPFLFQQSIQKNIFRTTVGVQLEEKEIFDVLERAALKEEIPKFAQGLQTSVGERGMGVSGGQRARIALARALAQKNPWLILDDVFASLDSSTEHQIVQQMARHRGLQTLLISTHRLSSLRICDVIYVLDQGRIIQKGTFENLSREPGLFRTLMDESELMQSLEVQV